MVRKTIFVANCDQIKYSNDQSDFWQKASRLIFAVTLLQNLKGVLN